MIFLFVLQIIFAVLLIAIVMLQSSEEDALSGIGGSIGNGAILSHKSSVDLITKFTIFLGCCLLVNSLALTKISKNRYSRNETIIEDYLKKQGKQLNTEVKVEEKKEEVINTEKTIENTKNEEKIEEKEVISNKITSEQNIEESKNITNEVITENTNK